jgi:hypothetical protein
MVIGSPLLFTFAKITVVYFFARQSSALEGSAVKFRETGAKAFEALVLMQNFISLRTYDCAFFATSPDAISIDRRRIAR